MSGDRTGEQRQKMSNYPESTIRHWKVALLPPVTPMASFVGHMIDEHCLSENLNGDIITIFSTKIARASRECERVDTSSFSPSMADGSEA